MIVSWFSTTSLCCKSSEYRVWLAHHRLGTCLGRDCHGFFKIKRSAKIPACRPLGRSHISVTCIELAEISVFNSYAKQLVRLAHHRSGTVLSGLKGSTPAARPLQRQIEIFNLGLMHCV